MWWSHDSKDLSELRELYKKVNVTTYNFKNSQYIQKHQFEIHTFKFQKGVWKFTFIEKSKTFA